MLHLVSLVPALPDRCVVVGCRKLDRPPGHERYEKKPAVRRLRGPDLVRAPDVGLVRRSRIPPGGPPDGFWPLAPDLAVEVLSPGDSASNVHRKVREYLRHGTRLVWIVDPANRTVTVHRRRQSARVLEAGEVLSGERVVPGFRCPVAAIFRPLALPLPFRNG
jgi:Uma2 family endonuclease